MATEPVANVLRVNGLEWDCRDWHFPALFRGKKAVDKDFERMGTEGQINAVEYDCCPESIFSSQVEHQVDLQRKLQEDPLVSIRTKEVDTRKKILDNPLKLREINAYVSNECRHL